MSGQRIIANLGYGAFDVNGVSIHHSGKVLSFGLINEYVVALFDWTHPDPRVNSKNENVLCFRTDGTLLWKLNLSKSGLHIGPFSGFNYSGTTSFELYLFGFGPPDWDCVADLSSGEFVRHVISAR